MQKILSKNKIYHVIVMCNNKDRIVSKVHDFDIAKIFKKACLELLDPNSHRGVHIVRAHTHKAPPSDLELKQGQLWCPYCRRAPACRPGCRRTVIRPRKR